MRAQPLKYWLGERRVYQNKKLVFTSSISPAEFMDIIGFDNPERIKASIIDYSGVSLAYRLDLKPNQHLYSTGISYQKLQAKAIDSREFNRLEIVCLDHKPEITITVD